MCNISSQFIQFPLIHFICRTENSVWSDGPTNELKDIATRSLLGFLTVVPLLCWGTHPIFAEIFQSGLAWEPARSYFILIGRYIFTCSSTYMFCCHISYRSATSHNWVVLDSSVFANWSCDAGCRLLGPPNCGPCSRLILWCQGLYQ